jgi:sugar phosphate isomerase/epimerase
MEISAMLTSLPLDFAEAARQVRNLGFTCVDVVALTDRPEEHLEALAETGLVVGCAAVGRGLPKGHTLDAGPVALRREALEEMKRQVADAARLGASHCYVVPGTDASPTGLERFGEACSLLADYAAARMVQLCVEHVPGRALPTAGAALEWLRRPGHDRLALLLDVGHCLISDEDPAQLAARAGRRLGYVHCDDNDSVADLHWPLLTGRLTPDMLEALLAELRLQGYAGRLALELSPSGPDPVGALRQGKVILEGMLRLV